MDLQKTDAEWLAFLRKTVFWFLRRGREVMESHYRATRRREQFVFTGPVTTINQPHSGNTISGASQSNTDENGRIWVRIATGSPNTVSWYKATGAGGGDLVAQGTGTDGNTATLTAQNSSGLSGTWRLPASPVAISSDTCFITPIVDYQQEPDYLFTADTDDEEHTRSAMLRCVGRLAEQDRNKMSALMLYLTEAFITASGNVVGEGKRFLRSETETLLWSEVANDDGADNITRTLVGIIQVLLAAMRDETAENEQDILRRVVARSAGTFASGNIGAGVFASGAGEQRCPIGRWTFVCTDGLGNGRGGTERFRGSFLAADSDLSFVIEGLVIKKTFELPNGGGAGSLVRSYSKSGDGSNVNVGAASTFSFDGETEDNTDNGVLYITTEANGPNWNFKFYSDSDRTTLVAQATNVATAAAGVQATGSAGLTVTFTVGSAPVDATANYSVDANFFSVSNSNDEPDSFYFDTTLTSEGVMSRMLALVSEFPGRQGLGMELNGDASGSELLPDGEARWSTFAMRANEVV